MRVSSFESHQEAFNVSLMLSSVTCLKCFMSMLTNYSLWKCFLSLCTKVFASDYVEKSYVLNIYLSHIQTMISLCQTGLFYLFFNWGMMNYWFTDAFSNMWLSKNWKLLEEDHKHQTVCLNCWENLKGAWSFLFLSLSLSLFLIPLI